jgi:hypothetical protein
VQFAVALTPLATTKAEKKNKDTSSVATERIRRDISSPRCEWREGAGKMWRGTLIHCFEGLIRPCDENSSQWLSITCSGCGALQLVYVLVFSK